MVKGERVTQTLSQNMILLATKNALDVLVRLPTGNHSLPAEIELRAHTNLATN